MHNRVTRSSLKKHLWVQPFKGWRECGVDLLQLRISPILRFLDYFWSIFFFCTFFKCSKMYLNFGVKIENETWFSCIFLALIPLISQFSFLHKKWPSEWTGVKLILLFWPSCSHHHQCALSVFTLSSRRLFSSKWFDLLITCIRYNSPHFLNVRVF